jgi:uncharacterized protein YegL
MSSNKVVSVGDAKSILSQPQVSKIDPVASQMMINSLNNTNILGCTGVGVDDLQTDDITLVSLILDASMSMSAHEAVVRESFDELINALKGSKQAGSMLISSRVFGTKQKILYGFKQVEEIAKNPIGSDYVANGSSTALYDSVFDAMTGIRVYSESLKQSGVRTKGIVIVMSDGEDNNSVKQNASDCKTLSEDFLKTESFVLVYVGFGSQDLLQIASEIGFKDTLISTKDASQIRKTMGVISKSIIRQSQTQIIPTNSFFS